MHSSEMQPTALSPEPHTNLHQISLRTPKMKSLSHLLYQRLVACLLFPQVIINYLFLDKNTDKINVITEVINKIFRANLYDD